VAKRTPKGGLAAVILAAGKGTRMRSQWPKVVHPVCGRAMVQHVAATALEAGADPVLAVVGHGAAHVVHILETAFPGKPIAPVMQGRQLGTGHAVLACAPHLKDHQGPVVILSGDVPLVTPALVRGMLAAHRKGGGGLTVLTVELADPTGYGRVLRDSAGRPLRIVEQKDANARERAVREINTGIYVADAPLLWSTLPRVSRGNSQGEYYLTDVVALALKDGAPVHLFRWHDPEEVLGVNSRADLARVSGILRRRIAEELMDGGVTLVDPERTYIHAGVTIGADTVVHPGVSLQGKTTIGSGCALHPNSRIVDSHLGDGVTVKDGCLITEARLEGENSVGPNAHLRPGAHLMRGARVGNFVEVKAAVIGEGSKVNHLSYVGDATVGKHVNIGAGTITCNYDGFAKHRTVIGDGAFIGSDTQLVAPVTVGAGAVIGAGSTITGDVPDGALAVSRVAQQNVAGWVARWKAGKAGAKSAKPPAKSKRSTKGRKP
jgi:bifunctional UDP-N-acetylglucosamine pyrophosphorylase / glucosamine-1-phosphate N-acetyltransferase